jgi:dipeptidyl aminopeptidase/acylaminoacyl peptidase
MLRRAALSIGLMLAVVAAVAGTANAAFPGRNGKLALGLPLATDQGFNEDIWTMEPDGSGAKRLTTEPTWEDQPAWSPNGRWIAFSRSESICCGERQGGGDIWIARADGTEQRRITNDPAHETSPSWSPDGSQIVFAATSDPVPIRPDPDYDLFVVNADGTGRLLLLLSTEHGSEFDPAWSPDGTRIAFATDIARSDGHAHPEVVLGIQTVRADGTGRRVVVPAGDLGYDPDWSPDGRWLAYTSGSNIFRVSADGSGSTAFPAGSYTGSRVDPSWSPDGVRIAYSGFLFGHMALDGSNNTLLACCVSGSSWQPLGPRRADFKHGPAFCRAEREFLGEQEFTVAYKSFGGCVSAKSQAVFIP